MKPDEIVALAGFVAGLAGFSSAIFYHFVDDRFEMSARQAAVVIVAGVALFPLVWAAGLFVGVRAFVGGVAEWRRALFTRQPSPNDPEFLVLPDPFLAAAEREVNEIAP